MMDDSKKRFQIGFIGSLGFHLFVFLVLAFAGLFTANNVDDKIVEIAVFGGGGGGGGGRAVEAIARRYEELVVDAQEQTVGIAHADCAPDAQILASLLRRSSKPPKKILTI